MTSPRRSLRAFRFRGLRARLDSIQPAFNAIQPCLDRLGAHYRTTPSPPERSGPARLPQPDQSDGGSRRFCRWPYQAPITSTKQSDIVRLHERAGGGCHSEACRSQVGTRRGWSWCPPPRSLVAAPRAPLLGMTEPLPQRYHENDKEEGHARATKTGGEHARSARPQRQDPREQLVKHG